MINLTHNNENKYLLKKIFDLIVQSTKNIGYINQRI